MTGTDATEILIEIPVDRIAAAVLDCPVTAIRFESALRACLFWGTTGYPQNDLKGRFSIFRINGLPLDLAHLPDMREIEVVIQRCIAPDATDFNSTMIRRRDLDKIRFLSILEK